jgi:ribosome-binding protein aMBF1 (putative translation factor)
MPKRAPGVPTVARPRRAAIAASGPPTPFAKGAVTPTVKADAAKPRRVSAKEPQADDVPPELQVIFGENLKAARLKRGLNQRQVAARSGLPQQYLSQIEQGQQNVTLKTVELLAKVLDHDVSTMLRRAKRPPEKNWRLSQN